MDDDHIDFSHQGTFHFQSSKNQPKDKKERYRYIRMDFFGKVKKQNKKLISTLIAFAFAFANNNSSKNINKRYQRKTN